MGLVAEAREIIRLNAKLKRPVIKDTLFSFKYICPDCDNKLVVRRENLGDYVYRIYSCDKCGYKFATKDLRPAPSSNQTSGI